MAEAGRPTELTDDVLSKIKKGILDGKTLKEIAQSSEIELNTLYGWSSDNYLNLADKIEGWKRDRKLMLAEKNIEEFLLMTDQNIKQVGEELVPFKDPQLTRIKADISKFVSETLGKDIYSKRSELTGKDGWAIETHNTNDTLDVLATQLVQANKKKYETIEVGQGISSEQESDTVS